MAETSNLMANYITERHEVNPAYHHNVKENETEESLSHYILSTTGNGTLTGRMKDEGLNSCVPIESCESKTGALRQDIKRRPDIRISQYHDRESNYYQHHNLQEDCRTESVHNIHYQNRDSQCPQYNLPKRFTDDDVFKIDEQQEIEDYKNNNTPYKEPKEFQTYSDLRDDSKISQGTEKLIVPNDSFSNQQHKRVPAKDRVSGEGHLYEIPFQDRISVVDDSSRNHDELKTRNEILIRNKAFPTIIQVHGDESVFSSSCFINDGYASAEMIQSVHNTKPKHAQRTSTITNQQDRSDFVEVENSQAIGQTIMSSRSAHDKVDAYNDVQTAYVDEGKGVHFAYNQREYKQTEVGHFKAGLQERLPFSKSPIGTAIRNELRQDAEMQVRNNSGYSLKKSNLVYDMQYRRISPSPLILRTNYDRGDGQTSDSKTENLGFALQDPPRKIKRQLSIEFERRGTFIPSEEDTVNSLTPSQEPGTSKRLKSSTYQNLQQTSSVLSDSHYKNVPQTANVPSSSRFLNHETSTLSSSPHNQNLQQTSNVPSSPHYQNHPISTVASSPYYSNHTTSTLSSSPHNQNLQQNLNVPQSPHIRTSSVIKTPSLKSKEENIFVFPDTATRPNSHEYRFHVSPHDSNDRLQRTEKEYLYNRTASTMSSEPYRPPSVTPQKGYNLLARSSADQGFYFGQKVSPEKRGPLRSQSNIEDQSPSKLSIAELDKIHLLRSISLPVSEHDQRFINRSMDRQESGYHFSHDTAARRQLFRENNHRFESIQHPHTHTYNCCSTFSRRQPLNGDINERCQGDIDMTIQCTGIVRECQDLSQQLKYLNHTQHHNRHCECKRVEDDVLQLALDAYRKIPKECYTQTEQRQRDKELNETNYMVLEAIKVALRMKQLCSHGRSVSRIYNGSVVIRLNCPTLNSLEDLWLKFKSGELQTLINNIFITPSILLKNNAKFINLGVTILKDEYRVCQAELASSFSNATVISPSKNASPFKRSPDRRAAKSAEDLLRIPDSPKANMTKTRSSSTPILLCHSPLDSPMENCSPNTSSKRERKFSFGDQSRRAFQDLNSPRSPNLFNLEEIRQIVESPLFDQDEDDQENISASFQSRGSNSRHGSPYSPLVSPKSPHCSPLSPRYSPR
ncbi:hypothetical protein LOTGIDRAFT_166189 [Lottia gigantea]|uniref:Uncharacterized protein n=1 Tax=Lottia gigantea TaxID=225164 RepID=V4A3T9_LOTGI|nr:hypothetical protein LOTGIDRAFT_166189 [Lottia gigantea]ESO87886.1 hypothetical protein LOTGIDRAFT_166189 [Lottia gigantea]